MSDEVVDVYADVFRFTVHPWGVSVSFGLGEPHPPATRVPASRDVAVVRLSLETAKALAMMLRQNLRTFERENDIEIAIPDLVYTSLGIAREDWSDAGTDR